MAPSTEKLKYVDELKSIYRQYAPDKVRTAAQVIEPLEPGTEAAFLNKMRKKYQKREKDIAEGRIPPQTGPPPPDPKARDELRRELTHLYEAHAPEKVELVEKSTAIVKPGTEKSFLQMTRKKYEDPNYVASPRKTQRSESETQHYTRELESLYQRYAPERVPTVAKVLATIPPGREDKFIENAREKYKERELQEQQLITPPAPIKPPTPPTPPMPPPAPVAEPPKISGPLSVYDYSGRLQAIYQQHCPHEIPNIDATLVELLETVGPGKEDEYIRYVANQYKFSENIQGSGPKSSSSSTAAVAAFAAATKRAELLATIEKPAVKLQSTNDSPVSNNRNRFLSHNEASDLIGLTLLSDDDNDEADAFLFNGITPLHQHTASVVQNQNYVDNSGLLVPLQHQQRYGGLDALTYGTSYSINRTYSDHQRHHHHVPQTNWNLVIL